MEVTEKFRAQRRSEWRRWLEVRVRVGYIEEMRRKPNEFERRLTNFVSKTAAGKMFGNWNDGGRLEQY